MTCKDGTAVDNDILAGTATKTTILILTALDADAIVACVELGVDNQCVLT